MTTRGLTGENANLYYIPIWHHSLENGGGPFGLVPVKAVDFKRLHDAFLYPYFAELLAESRGWGTGDELSIFQDSFHSRSQLPEFGKASRELKTPNMLALDELHRRGGRLSGASHLEKRAAAI